MPPRQTLGRDRKAFRSGCPLQLAVPGSQDHAGSLGEGRCQVDRIESTQRSPLGEIAGMSDERLGGSHSIHRRPQFIKDLDSMAGFPRDHPPAADGRPKRGSTLRVRQDRSSNAVSGSEQVRREFSPCLPRNRDLDKRAAIEIGDRGGVPRSRCPTGSSRGASWRRALAERAAYSLGPIHRAGRAPPGAQAAPSSDAEQAQPPDGPGRSR